MNFVEAVQLVYTHPAGPDAIAVRRPNSGVIVFYDRTLFLGVAEFGLRWASGPDGESNIYSPTFADVMADDWEIAE